MKQTRLGIIRESKIPPDARTPLTPRDCRKLLRRHASLEIYIQPSRHRCYAAQEYAARGVHVREDLSNCDILMGIKEVQVPNLISGKTYLFFSHTIKKQPHNKELLRQILNKEIELIDYECFTDKAGERLVGFGRFAGIVGAHNGLWAWGKRTGAYTLKRAFAYADYEALQDAYQGVNFPPIKIAITGSGRAAHGALEMVEAAGFKKVTPADFIHKTFKEAVYTQLTPKALFTHKAGKKWSLQDFFDHPEHYENQFAPYTKVTDLLINAIYWAPNIDRLFTKSQIKQPDFNIRIIADITCDINGSVPCTLKAATIEKPVYGYDPEKATIIEPFTGQGIDVMSVDNLPNELPRDASIEFSEDLADHVMDLLLTNKSHPIIQRAIIARNGSLCPAYRYLDDFVGVV